MNDPRHFRAGDVVRHGPSGEKWVLACDEDSAGRSGPDTRGRVLPAGYPETLAEAVDCTLVRAATDAERREQLEQSAGPGAGHRTVVARHQLAQEPDVEPRKPRDWFEKELDKSRVRQQRALVAMDACEALGIELPPDRCPDDLEPRIVWGALLRVANPHVSTYDSRRRPPTTDDRSPTGLERVVSYLEGRCVVAEFDPDSRPKFGSPQMRDAETALQRDIRVHAGVAVGAEPTPQQNEAMRDELLLRIEQAHARTSSSEHGET